VGTLGVGATVAPGRPVAPAGSGDATGGATAGAAIDVSMTGASGGGPVSVRRVGLDREKATLSANRARASRVDVALVANAADSVGDR
jgi:hypothetical protein